MMETRLPVNMESVGEELVVQELVSGEDGPHGDAEVHELAAEEPEGVAIVFVVDVLLEVTEHSTHLLLRVVHNATRCAWINEQPHH